MDGWIAPAEVIDLINKLKEQYHHPRLEEAKITASFQDSKPFTNNQINLGKVSKLSPLVKLHVDFDFSLIICADVWQEVFNAKQKEAYLDLQLSRCSVAYEKEFVVENGKKHPVKDEFGRIKYSTTILRDKNDLPKWKLLPLDLEVFSGNVRRYGLWYDGLQEFKEAIESNEAK